MEDGQRQLKIKFSRYGMGAVAGGL